MPEKLITFNIRLVPESIASKLTEMAAESGIKRERYIRRLLELHVEQARRTRRRKAGQYVLKSPAPERVAASIAKEA